MRHTRAVIYSNVEDTPACAANSKPFAIVLHPYYSSHNVKDSCKYLIHSCACHLAHAMPKSHEGKQKRFLVFIERTHGMYPGDTEQISSFCRKVIGGGGDLQLSQGTYCRRGLRRIRCVRLKQTIDREVGIYSPSSHSHQTQRILSPRSRYSHLILHRACKWTCVWYVCGWRHAETREREGMGMAPHE